MNPQKKRHRYDGGWREILHCRCRYADSPHDVFLVLPHGEVATKEGPGLYSWTDSEGAIHRTIAYKRNAKMKKTGAPRRKEEIFRDATLLYEELGSWGKVARKLTPTEFEKEPRGAANRLRLGALYYQRTHK